MNTNTNSQPKNKLKILIIVAIAILVIVALVISWVETYWYYVDKMIFPDSQLDKGIYKPNWVMIVVDYETADKIISGEITIEDFRHNNIDSIGSSNQSITIVDVRNFTVYLKKAGIRECKQVALHLMTLPFIDLVYCP